MYLDNGKGHRLPLIELIIIIIILLFQLRAPEEAELHIKHIQIHMTTSVS
jgi:hypothetical protein